MIYSRLSTRSSKSLIIFIFFNLGKLFVCLPDVVKPKLTLDDFFEHSDYSSLSLSPSGRYLLVQTTRPLWKMNSFESILWLYDVRNNTRMLVTKNLQSSIKPQWSPDSNWIALFLNEPPVLPNQTFSRRYLTEFQAPPEQFVYLYSLISNDLLPIDIGKEMPVALTWSNKNSSFYLVTSNSSKLNKRIQTELDQSIWNDVDNYRKKREKVRSTIFHVEIMFNHQLISIKRNIIQNFSFLVGELLYIPSKDQIVLTSKTDIIENLQYFEIYMINLKKQADLQRLTDNEVIETNLKLSADEESVIFQTISVGSMNSGRYNDTQGRLYSIHLNDRLITRLAEKFDGHIEDFTIRPDGGVTFLGQLGIETHIYSHNASSNELIEFIGWNGTYQFITSSSIDGAIAFVYSSLQQPMEVYYTEKIDRLLSAKAVTYENKLLNQRERPRTSVYRWQNPEDHRTIEGILHYPSGRDQSKNLPLLVLIHDGPYHASRNSFGRNSYTWASLAASEGWLVLEPNYRGSTGYGDSFLHELRYQPVSLPGKDILFGVDQLIKEEIVNPYRLVVGGYGFGGFLTNWLITRTKQFNAALSGAGSLDFSSEWGSTDAPTLLTYLFGGFPWETSHIYFRETPLYQLDRVRTPTLITIGENDMRVPLTQSLILERALYHHGIPVELLMFPNEDHHLSQNPWSGKLKVREELKWLQKYGHERLYD